MSKTRRIAGWSLAGLIGAFLLFSAFGKLTMPEMADMFASKGLEDWRIIIAIGEITSVLLFLIPLTNVFGTFMLSSYLGGAILLHMTGMASNPEENFIIPAILLILVWITSFIRNPHLLLAK